MPSYRTAFPSKYLKADDVHSRPILTIGSVEFENVGTGANQESKLVAHFIEASKPLVLNLINSDSIAELAESDDYTQWLGTKIQLFAAKTEFQGKRVPCVRICAPPIPSKAGTAKAGRTRPTAPASPVADDDADADEAPF